MKLISKIERRDLVPRKSYESDKMKQNAGESSKRVLIGTIYFIAFALTWLVKTREYPTDFLSMSVSVGLLGIGGSGSLEGLVLAGLIQPLPKRKLWLQMAFIRRSGIRFIQDCNSSPGGSACGLAL